MVLRVLRPPPDLGREARAGVPALSPSPLPPEAEPVSASESAARSDPLGTLSTLPAPPPRIPGKASPLEVRAQSVRQTVPKAAAALALALVDDIYGPYVGERLRSPDLVHDIEGMPYGEVSVELGAQRFAFAASVATPLRRALFIAAAVLETALIHGRWEGAFIDAAECVARAHDPLPAFPASELGRAALGDILGALLDPRGAAPEIGEIESVQALGLPHDALDAVNGTLRASFVDLVVRVRAQPPKVTAVES